MTYSQKRHIELLKLSQDLENQKKSLFIENTEEYLELAEYDAIVEEHILWQDRHKIALVMENFLNKKIDGEDFCDHVYGLRRTLRNACEEFNLKLISSSETIQDFQHYEFLPNLSLAGLLTVLFCECDNFMDDYENEQFYNDIQTFYFNLQKKINKE